MGRALRTVAGGLAYHVLNHANDVQRVDISVAPVELSLARDKAILGFHLKAREGSDFDPAAVQIYRENGTPVTPKYARADLLGTTDSLVVAELAAGNYSIDVSGQIGSRSQFRLDVFLVGDVDGDHTVDRDDLNLIRQSYGARAGSSRYQVSADANLDGRITAFDLSMARRNERDSRPVLRPLCACEAVRVRRLRCVGRSGRRLRPGSGCRAARRI